MEETLNPRRAGPPHEKVKNKRQHDPVPRHEHSREKHKNEAPSESLTRLNTSKTNILMDHGHTTKDCQALQREIEALIKRGFLRNYIGHDKCPRNDRDNRKEPRTGGSAQLTAGTINIIVGGIASGGDTNSGRKQYARQHAHTPMESRDEVKDITFGARDLEQISYPHDDTLVVSTVVANFEGFGGGVIIPEGIVKLPLTLGFGNIQVMEITPFQVVNTPMAYNIILGRPLLNKIQAIVSIFHLAMKFPTD
ncbi:uncharacterized protein LOC111408496 [Olea europaea var. sylvestris]|uniref:uncharacterized protein LOC111408496 n=1 Tax=Olea europaea var. sylvestris TaxID=158386 RepID=UPI000C1CE082|nr:uncharacterized protein LOC111408496 [Olea europaea var. sylvestris]